VKGKWCNYKNDELYNQVSHLNDYGQGNVPVTPVSDR